ncbi:uncharacterized protein JN550_001018 [Neoarthrinium moseri]|uniref:uncharacterized protein n=1 Tax=Neoarthrinium moseri TaxID=1658444 RepID=UPI001FDBD782|nr:uncharacterized protein JN550_001018 [Neoarthrinium moseri]KAI1876946.1 hypothetical protein JN550_001018 [Neoarthrinium moseri]
MPKKRHQTKYSKPPSIAPPTLRISSSSQRTPEHHDRSVNEILADMRRSTLSTSSPQDILPQPSVPPQLRWLLQHPETPAPRPRRLQRRDINGRRIPPGPPPPRSWLALSQSRHAPAQVHKAATNIQYWPLPGAYVPGDGSFIDMALHRLVDDWAVQKDWNRFYLYTMPNRLRTALIFYVSKYHDQGISSSDLRLILAGPPETELAEYDLEKPEPARFNKNITHLDLAGSIGKGLSLKSLMDLLLPVDATPETEIQDSWDAPEIPEAPACLLPNLTQLSLAVTGPGQAASWRQLLVFSTKLPQLTHLNLSGWPTPSTTPNATLAKMVSPVTGTSVHYGGTNAYSHSLDDDWSEAISVLKRLSKALYGLEYLDLTGCGDWFPALRKEADAHLVIDLVDWARDWSKITSLRLCSGYVAEPGSDSQEDRLREWKREALAVEKHIIAQRAGQGRFITVETDVNVSVDG